MFDSLKEKGFQFEFHSHAEAILLVDFPDIVYELETVLQEVAIPVEEIIGSGGGETKGTQRLRKALDAAGWVKTNFTIEKIINGIKRESQSHEVDHVRTYRDQRVIALEIEWNNKDPFFDRDLENFKRLHAEGAISVGIIITRGTSLQDQMTVIVEKYADLKKLSDIEDLKEIGLNPTPRQSTTISKRVERGDTFQKSWASTFTQDKYGAATTHWRKLEDRVHRGVGNPCPLLLIGLPASVVKFTQ